MDKQEDIERFEAALQRLVGLECWSMVAGSLGGAMVSLDFGAKIPRSEPLSNPRLTEEQRQFEGELSLFVQLCPWRLDSAEAVVGSWRDDSAAMWYALNRLAGQKVARVELEQPSLDLAIGFENGLTLRVFCDQTNVAFNRNPMTNYTLFTPEFIYAVEGRSRLEIGASED